MPHALDSLEAFYACALAIEREAAERYREFAAYFAGRGEAMLAALCTMLARMEGEHYSQLARAAEGLALPSVDLAAYGAGAEPPSEGGGRELFYRMQDPAQLRRLRSRARSVRNVSSPGPRTPRKTSTCACSRARWPARKTATSAG